MARFTRRAEATGKADTTEGIVMKRLAAALSLVLVLGLALPGCAADEGTEPSGSTTGEEATSGEPIIIGSALCQTGIQAPLDEPALRGAQLAVDVLNEQGGILAGRWRSAPWTARATRWWWATWPSS